MFIHENSKSPNVTKTLAFNKLLTMRWHGFLTYCMKDTSHVKKFLYFIFSSIVVVISCACTKTSPDFRVVHVPPLKALTIQISMMKGDFSAGGAY